MPNLWPATNPERIASVDRLFIRLGAVFAFVGVALGAFGAHALRTQLSVEHLAVFETGVRYQLIHAIALVLVGVLIGRRPARLTIAAGWCFTVGIVLFSGSLYLLTLTGTTALGIVTPFGGLCFLTGWACLAVGDREP
jgi:uncharacterized membrane protein YgdD (TMEM256/DUF423 family)